MLMIHLIVCFKNLEIQPVSYTHLDVYKRQSPYRCFSSTLVFLLLLKPNVFTILQWGILKGSTGAEHKVLIYPYLNSMPRPRCYNKTITATKYSRPVTQKSYNKLLFQRLKHNTKKKYLITTTFYHIILNKNITFHLLR